MKFQYYSAPCGAGKSHHAANLMTTIPGRYLVVRDRVEAIEEFGQMLFGRTKGRVPIEIITSDSVSSVRLRVEDTPNRFDSVAHCIVLITHKALLMSDFSGFTGWHIIIDETPVIMDRQDLQTSRSQAFFEQHYELGDAHGSWKSVTLTREGWNTTPADLEADDLLRSLRVFHERVISATPLPDDATARMARLAHNVGQAGRAVIQNLEDWSDMADGRRWTWWSLWSPHQLAAFETVQWMANGFEHSVTFALLRALHPEVEWEPVELPLSRAFARRKVIIRHFANRHVASQKLFDSEEGATNLAAIAHHMRGANQIWMANDRHAEHLQGIGCKLRPHQAGSNQYADYHAATAIYAAKPSGETREVMRLLGVEPDIWTRSYEHEVILQFMCRTSVRDPESTQTVTLTVYDSEQADYLATYFAAQPHYDVSVELIDLGFAEDFKSKSGGRPAQVMSVEEAKAKAEADKAKRAAAARERRAREKASKVDA